MLAITPSDLSIPAMAWPVQRYSRREGSNWLQVDDGTGSFTLLSKVSKWINERLQFPLICVEVKRSLSFQAGQLMLIQNGTVLESLPLANHTQVHAIVRGDTLLVAARHQVNSIWTPPVLLLQLTTTKESVPLLSDLFFAMWWSCWEVCSKEI